MKLKELKESIDDTLEKLGDMDVYVMYKNPFTGAIIQNAQEIVLSKMKRDDKPPFMCFALSACTLQPTEQVDSGSKEEIFKDCTTEL